MEFIIVPQLILVLSLFGVLLVLGRNFSRFKDVYEEERRDRSLEETVERIKNEEEKFKYLCHRLAKRVNFHAVQEKHKRISGIAHVKLEKILRKTRIGFLKLDSKFVVLIEKLRKRKKEIQQIENAEPAVDKISKFETGEPAKNLTEKQPPLTPSFAERGVDKAFLTEESHSSLTPSSKKTGRGEGEIKKIGEEGKYLETISDDPKNTDAYWKLGILYSRKRNYRDALNCFKQIVKIKPDYGKAKKKIKDISEKIRK